MSTKPKEASPADLLKAVDDALRPYGRRLLFATLTRIDEEDIAGTLVAGITSKTPGALGSSAGIILRHCFEVVKPAGPEMAKEAVRRFLVNFGDKLGEEHAASTISAMNDAL
jgi:hypothetical protein